MSPFATITPRHMELLAAVVKNLKTADVDWEAVATDANYKTAKYARDEYAKAWKKLQAAAAPSKDKEGGDAAAEDGNPAATPTTSTPKTKKRKAATEETPAKGKKGKTSGAAIAEAKEVKGEPGFDNDNVEGEAEAVQDGDMLS